MYLEKLEPFKSFWVIQKLQLHANCQLLTPFLRFVFLKKKTLVWFVLDCNLLNFSFFMYFIDDRSDGRKEETWETQEKMAARNSGVIGRELT